MTVLRSLPAPDAPARFEAWPADIKTRAFELWSTIAIGSAPRTEHLLAQEAGEGGAVPAASTIRAWAAEDDWKSLKEANLEQTHGRTLRQLQANSLMQIALAQSTLIDAMIGLLDDAPYGGAGRIKAAEASLRMAERSGIRLVGSELEVLPVADAGKPLTLAERARRQRERIVEDNAELG
jgi:hypothetical protein